MFMRTGPLFHPHDPPTDGWRASVTVSFAHRRGDRRLPFPCIFGVDALRRGSLRLAYVDRSDDDLGRLAVALEEFTQHPVPSTTTSQVS